MLCASAYTCVYTLHGIVYEATCCLAWGFFFDKRRDRGIVCVFPIFNAGGSVCKCICVYTHTHTHTAHMGYSNVSPRVWIRHLEGPKNPDGLNLGIYVFTCVQSTHVYVYICIRTCVQSTHVYVSKKEGMAWVDFW